MLNPFPDILFLGAFYTPLILRATIGLVFLWAAYQHAFKRRGAIQESLQTKPVYPSIVTPLIRPFAPHLALIIALVEAALGIAFIVGFLTQVAALFAIVILLKMLFFKKRFGPIAFESRTLYLVLIAIAISLFLSGAGAFALDIPL